MNPIGSVSLENPNQYTESWISVFSHIWSLGSRWAVRRKRLIVPSLDSSSSARMGYINKSSFMLFFSSVYSQQAQVWTLSIPVSQWVCWWSSRLGELGSQGWKCNLRTSHRSCRRLVGFMISEVSFLLWSLGFNYEQPSDRAIRQPCFKLNLLRLLSRASSVLNPCLGKMDMSCY